jgi:hypothetical protein
LSPRPAKTARAILTIYICQTTRSRARIEVPFGGPNASKNFQGVHFPQKHPKNGPGTGSISSLNKTMNEFSTVHTIFAQISSIDAQPVERNRKISTESPKFPSKGHILEKCPQWGSISSQNTLLKNFSPVQQILTSNTPIDSARPAETHGNNNFPNFILGEQPGNFDRKYPLE